MLPLLYLPTTALPSARPSPKTLGLGFMRCQSDSHGADHALLTKRWSAPRALRHAGSSCSAVVAACHADDSDRARVRAGREQRWRLCAGRAGGGERGGARVAAVCLHPHSVRGAIVSIVVPASA